MGFHISTCLPSGLLRLSLIAKFSCQRHLLIAKTAERSDRSWKIIIKTEKTDDYRALFFTLKAILSVIGDSHLVTIITLTDRTASRSCPADTRGD